MDLKSIGLTGVGNARQLGGYTGADNRKIKMDTLLRTGKLAEALPEDLEGVAGAAPLRLLVKGADQDRAPEPVDGSPGLPARLLFQGHQRRHQGCGRW